MKRRKRARRTAKQLIEQTIQRNQSPVPPSPPPPPVGVDNATVESSSLSSRASEESTTKTVAEHDVPGGRSIDREVVVSDDFNAGVGGDEVSMLLGDYQHTVTVGRNHIKISGSNLQLVEVSL